MVDLAEGMLNLQYILTQGRVKGCLKERNKDITGFQFTLPMA